MHKSIIKSSDVSASLFYFRLNNLSPVHFLKMILFGQHQSFRGTSRNIGQCTMLVVLGILDTDILILFCFLLFNSVSMLLLVSTFSLLQVWHINNENQLEFLFLQMVFLALPSLRRQLLCILSLQRILALLCS